MQVRGDEWRPIDAPDSWMEVGIALQGWHNGTVSTLTTFNKRWSIEDMS